MQGLLYYYTSVHIQKNNFRVNAGLVLELYSHDKYVYPPPPVPSHTSGCLYPSYPFFLRLPIAMYHWKAERRRGGQLFLKSIFFPRRIVQGIFGFFNFFFLMARFEHFLLFSYCATILGNCRALSHP